MKKTQQNVELLIIMKWGQIVLENMVEGATIFKSLKKINSKKVIRYNIYHVNLCKI